MRLPDHIEGFLVGYAFACVTAIAVADAQVAPLPALTTIQTGTAVTMTNAPPPHCRDDEMLLTYLSTNVALCALRIAVRMPDTN